jgi:hypothetical protein
MRRYIPLANSQYQLHGDWVRTEEANPKQVKESIVTRLVHRHKTMLLPSGDGKRFAASANVSPHHALRNLQIN